MIDEFELMPQEEPFDPFAVMLFKALQVLAFLFFIALLAIAPEAKDGKIDSKAEFLVTMAWPDQHPDDFDMFVQDPLGNMVWYRRREAGFMLLDRDDRGAIRSSMNLMSDGMAVAMYTTLAGLVGSILVKIQYYMLDDATAKLFAYAVSLTEVRVVSILEAQPGAAE